MQLPESFKKIRLTSNQFIGLVCVLVALVICLVCVFFLKPEKKIDFSQELKTISASVRKHYQKNIDYRGLETKIIVDDKVLPQTMVRNGKIYSAFKGEILIGRNLKGDAVLPFENFFSVTYLNINRQKCEGLIASTFDETSGLTAITVSNEKLYEFTYGGELSLPVSEQKAKEICASKNDVMFTFE